MNIKEEKTNFRKEMLGRLKAQTAEARDANSELICNKIIGLEIVKKAFSIMMYVSDMYEVQTHDLVRQLLKDGKKVVIPYLDSLRNIIPCEIKDLYHDTEMTPYGYREPTMSCKRNSFKINELDAVFVPGVAFDTCGNRLGRGWGCYDRFLCDIVPGVPTIGLGFDFQVCETIPTSDHDIKLSEIISN